MDQGTKLLARSELQKLPEFGKLIEKMEKSQCCTLFYLDRLTSGKSGALVYHVGYRSQANPKISNFVLKLRKRESGSAEEELQHKKAFDDAGTFGNEHMPELFASVHDRENSALLYTIAGLSFREFHALSGRWDAKRLLKIFTTVNRGILEDWNSGFDTDSGLHPTKILQKWLGSKLSSGRIDTFLSNHGVDPNRPRFYEGHETYPNPLAYAKQRNLWKGSRNISAILGHLHGDLNTNNLLARFMPQYSYEENVEPEYYMIDFTDYKEKSFLFFDNAYLELSYLLENRRHIGSEWTQLCLAKISGRGEVPAQLEVFCSLMSSTRKDIDNWIDKFGRSGMKDDLQIQYRLAGVAAGLNFCSKRKLSNNDRYRALMYSAMNLKIILDYMGVRLPSEGSLPEFRRKERRPNGLDNAQNSNIHIINMAVTPENVKDDLAKMFTQKWKHQRRYPERTPVFVLYTGGTVGMVRSDPSDRERESQLVIGSLGDILKYLDKLRDLHFDIDFYSFEKPLDSSNIVAEHWVRIAQIIGNCYNYYQGFVILHGTDTMAYTASALSFMFENLGKPIILTGAERPPSDINSDAEVNITNAIRLAAPQVTPDLLPIPEVCILFANRLMRANRTKKLQSLSMDKGFDSPNYTYLGKLRAKIEINNDLVPPHKIEPRNFKVDPRIRPEQVWILDVFPNMKIEKFASVMLDNGVRGVILRTFGTGNAPSSREFLAVIRKAVNSGKIVVNLTQCPRGETEVRLFETNAHLFDLGVINGGDMTSEAAFCKLSFLLEKYKDEIDAIKSEMQIDLRGEMTYSAHSISYLKGRVNKIFNGEPKHIGNLNTGEIHHARLRLYDLRVAGKERGDIKLKVLINCGPVDMENWMNHEDHLIANISRYWERKAQTLQHWEGKTATEAVVKNLADRDGTISLHVVSEGDSPVTFGVLELSIFSKRCRSDF